MKKYIVVFLSAIIVLGISMGAHAQKAEYTLKLGTDGPAQHPYNIGATQLLIPRVKELTNGRVEIKLYPGASLGDELTMMDSLSIGDLDMCIAAVPNASQHIPKLNFFSLSYLFNGPDHYFRTIKDDVFLKKVENMISEEKLGLRPLAIFTPGLRNFYTNKGKLRTPKELKGLNIRVMAAPIESRIWKRLGTNPVSIPTGDVYTGLQTGLLDAAEHELGAYYSHSIYEVAPFYSNTGHQWTCSLFLISDKTWNKLPSDIKNALKQAAKEYAQFVTNYVINVFDKKTREKLKDKVTFYQVDKEAFKKVLVPLQDEVAKEYQVEDLLALIRKLGKK